MRRMLLSGFAWACALGLIGGCLHVGTSLLGFGTGWLKTAAMFAGVGVVWSFWYQIGMLREDVRILRLQVLRHTMDELGEADRLRLEDEDSLDELTPQDTAAAKAATNRKRTLMIEP